MCPLDSQRRDKLLHRPITLHCGHTISSSHVSLPRIPSPDVTLAANADEAHAIMQAHQTRKLAMWTGVRCPLPVCRQHQQFRTDGHENGEQDPSTVGSPRERLRGQGVQYYPARAPPLEVETLSDPVESEVANEKQILDVTVGKALALVMREIELQEILDSAEDRWLTGRAISQMGDSESEADADDEAGGEPESRGDPSATPFRGVVLGGAISSSALGLLPQSAAHSVSTRNSSKRRRRSTQTSSSPSDTDEQSTDGRPRLNNAQRWRSRESRSRPVIHMDASQQSRMHAINFEKELMGIMECDVCSQMLHEPVTTPCQHVSARLENLL
jgi:hypothetical protein